MSRETGRGTARTREALRCPERPRRSKRGPQMPRETEQSPEPRKALRHREAQRGQRGKERWRALGTRGGSIRDNLFLVLVEEQPSSRLPRNALGVLGGSAHDRLLTKPVKERTISEPRECPRRHYEVRGERSRPKTALLVHKYVIRLMLYWTVALT